MIVSNPNGVNLHFIGNIYENPKLRFKPQRGKFTRAKSEFDNLLQECFKPQRGKFTLKEIRSEKYKKPSFKPQRGKFTLSFARKKSLMQTWFQTPTG